MDESRKYNRELRERIGCDSIRVIMERRCNVAVRFDVVGSEVGRHDATQKLDD